MQKCTNSKIFMKQKSSPVQKMKEFTHKKTLHYDLIYLKIMFCCIFKCSRCTIFDGRIDIFSCWQISQIKGEMMMEKVLIVERLSLLWSLTASQADWLLLGPAHCHSSSDRRHLSLPPQLTHIQIERGFLVSATPKLPILWLKIF